MILKSKRISLTTSSALLIAQKILNGKFISGYQIPATA
jgi:hypothetical protein